MIPVTARWRASVPGFNRWHPEIEVSRDGKHWTSLPFNKLTVVEDSTSATRFTLDATVRVDDDSLISTFGSQARVWISMADTGERIQKGLFRINTRTRTLGSKWIDIKGVSYEAHLIDARLPAARIINSGTVESMVSALIRDVLPTTRLWFKDPDIARVVLPRMSVTRDRWAALDGKDGSTSEEPSPSIAKSLGQRIFAGNDGTLVIGPPRSLADPAMLTIHTGVGGTQMSAVEGFERDPIFNGCSAKGTVRQDGKGNRNVIGPVLVVDGDPQSATYWHRSIDSGGFGKVPIFFASPLITSLSGLASAGRAILAPRLGAKKQLQLAAMFDPSWEAEDVLMAEGPGGDEKVVVDKINWDFEKRTMKADTRASSSDQAGLVQVLVEGGDLEQETDF